MVLFDEIEGYIKKGLDTIQKKNIGSINDTITKTITEQEQKAIDIIASIENMAFKSIGSHLSQITSLLPLCIRIATTFYNLPLDLAFRKYYGSERLGIENYVDLYHRKLITESKLLSICRFLGYDAKTVDNANKLFFKFVGLSDYIRLFRREFITSAELDDYSGVLGYNNKELDNLKKLTEFYPSTSDLVSFAVREAFEPDDKLWIHEGNIIPEPFSDYGKRIGLKPEWIKRFWHSHWRLLGSGQILESFHRGFIKESELLEYLKRLDYTEKDRELILSMSYNLLTRVDIRRVFEQGLISSKELFDYYGTLGFSKKDKILMTSLSKQLRFIDVKDLRKLYIDEFEQGLTTENEVKVNLKASGLDLDEINLFLYYSDKVYELEFTKELKAQITQRFYEGSIDFDELVQQLRDLGVSNRELKRIEKNAVLFDFKKIKLPTIAELKRYLKKEIIDLTKFVYYALRIGYGSEHIFWILADMEYKV